MPDATDALVDQLRWAAEVVRRAGVEHDLRAAAFQHVLRAAPALRASGFAPSLPVFDGPGLAAAATTPPLERIAAELDLHQDAVELVYDEDDHGSVRLRLSAARLPASRAAAMRNVAVTLAVGRQIVRPEEATPYALLRDECDQIGVLDGPNFATELRRLELRVTGGRNTKVAKVRRSHRELVRVLIESLVATGRLA